MSASWQSPLHPRSHWQASTSVAARLYWVRICWAGGERDLCAWYADWCGPGRPKQNGKLRVEGHWAAVGAEVEIGKDKALTYIDQFKSDKADAQSSLPTPDEGL